MTTTVSTTVKVVVSMVVVAALVATTFSSKASTGLKGSRKLQFSGITLASSQGVSNTGASITTGVFGASMVPVFGGTGASFGNGNAVGTSNGFIYSAGGQAISSGTSGGNSTSASDLTVLSAMGGGLSGGTLSSIGKGAGAAGGNAVFGPSLAAAIAAATPIAPTSTAPPAEVVVVAEDSKKGGGSKNKNKAKTTTAVITAAPAAPTAPAFDFTVGLPTGGGGGGFGSGSGTTTGAITSPGNIMSQQYFADEAYGNALSNGFGFGMGSGIAVNAFNEQAGGSGGATSFGMGDVNFELDDINTAYFANSGSTISSGGAGAYVGSAPPVAKIFGAFITPPAMAGP